MSTLHVIKLTIVDLPPPAAGSCVSAVSFSTCFAASLTVSGPVVVGAKRGCIFWGSQRLPMSGSHSSVWSLGWYRFSSKSEYSKGREFVHTDEPQSWI